MKDQYTNKELKRFDELENDLAIGLFYGDNKTTVRRVLRDAYKLGKSRKQVRPA